MRFKHGGDIGDLLAHLTIIKYLGGGDLVLAPLPEAGNRMTQQRVDSLEPWFAQQDFLWSTKWYAEAPPGCFNLDHWRNNCHAHMNLSDIAHHWLGIPPWPPTVPWMRVDKVDQIAKVLILRTNRWRNPANSFPWGKVLDMYGKDAAFVGLPDEHKAFERETGPIPYCKLDGFLAMARAAAGAELIVANSTGFQWVAESLKRPVLIEVGLGDNTRFNRADAWYITHHKQAIPTLDEVAKCHELAKRGEGRPQLVINVKR